MVDWWWGVIAAALPAAAVQHARRVGRRKKLEEKQKLRSGGVRGRDKDSAASSAAVLEASNIFVCERVCASKRLLNKLGAFSKDPNPSNTCVTVCGASQVDACSDACARAVCSNQHHISNWNDICLRRCQNQCLQLQPSSP